MGAAAVPIFTAVASSLASGLVQKMFADKPKKAEAPEPEPVTAMPDPMAQKAAARRKASLLSQQQMGASDTILSGGSNTLGG